IHLSLQTIPSYFFPYFYGRLWHKPFGVALFDWTYAPGWLTPLCLFFGLPSLAYIRRRPGFSAGFFWLVSLLTLAKIFNLPLVRSFGTLPYLDRVVFPRSATFLPAFALSSLAATGISFLAEADNRTWLNWVVAWTVIASAIFLLGTISIRGPLRDLA